MSTSFHRRLFTGTAVAACAVLSVPAFAQAAPAEGAAAEDNALGEIVVTANKRVQNLQDVGLTVGAISGDTLKNQKISTLSDLAQAVPGLTFAQTPNNTPVYTLRGVGFFESSLAAYPDVSVYLDQIPLPFPVLTTLTAFDLDRLEVLKGPQGTLFGQNATGGAINYIAAKPTDSLRAGVDLSYGRFNQVEASAYISGPLSDTLRARLAVRKTHGDDWQRSYTRNDTLGENDTTAVRLLIDWEPSDRFKLEVNLNGWQDKSDPLAPQAFERVPQNTAIPANYASNIFTFAPNNARSADWSPGIRPFANNKFRQAAARADWEAIDDITLTSISSYIDYDHKQRVEGDGTFYEILDVGKNTGDIESFTQELRIANGAKNPFRWVLGANYEHSDVFQSDAVQYDDSSSSFVNSPLAGQNFYQAGYFSDQKLRNYAVFGNVEYDLGERLTVKGGLRYTKAKRASTNSTFDLGDGGTSGLFTNAINFYRQVFGFPGFIPRIPIGATVSLNPATGFPETFRDELNENSTSWMAGVNYKASDDLLLYVNVSKGYKAGSFPTVSAGTTLQNAPVVQESLIDYEGGFKATLFDRRLTINGAAFFYDYKDKQLRAKIVDPFFNALDGLVNVPKSRVKGAELEISARPMDGLSIGGAVTYVDAKVRKYTGVTGSAVSGGLFVPVTANFAGARLPFAPKWQSNFSADYSFPLTASMGGFLGATVSSQSKSLGVLVIGPVDEKTYELNARTLVSVRAGLQSADGTWKLMGYGRNIFNKYYWTNTIQTYDTIVRYPGKPAEYGITLSYNFR